MGCAQAHQPNGTFHHRRSGRLALPFPPRQSRPHQPPSPPLSLTLHPPLTSDHNFYGIWTLSTVGGDGRPHYGECTLRAARRVRRCSVRASSCMRASHSVHSL